MVALMLSSTKPARQRQRAVSRTGAAQLMGVNVNGTIALTFNGPGLAAIAGVLFLLDIFQPHLHHRAMPESRPLLRLFLW